LPKRLVHLFLLLWVLPALCLSRATWAQDDEEDAFKLARNLFRDAGDYATAAELFAEYIRNYPDSPNLAEGRLMLARAYGRSGHCATAVSAYETFYQEHPDHLEIAAARRERAACLAATGRHLEAAHAYEEVQRRFSVGEFAAQVLLDAGANYTQAGQLEQADRAYRRAIDEYPDQPQAHAARFRLALLLFAGGHPEKAQQQLAAIAAAEPPPTEAPAALLLSGRIDFFLGNQEGGGRKFARLQERFSASSQADSSYLERADYLYDRRQFLQAGDAYGTALEAIADARLQKRALLGLADARRQSRQTDQALGHYRQLLEKLAPDHPNYLRATLGLAIAYGQAGRFATAVGLFHELLQAAPDSPEAIACLRELGELYQRRSDHARAISWYRRYLQEAGQAADRAEVQFSLAGIYVSTNDYEAAISIYQPLAQSRGVLAAEAQYALAQAFEAGGMLRAALREHVVFLEQFPAHHRAPAARDRVEYLREFTVMDASGLNRALQQGWIDELSGRPRQLVQLDVARALYAHHDFANAVRTFEHYAAAFQGGAYSSEAQYFLAESLLKLGRQRQLEGRLVAADSLRQLALQEYRILAHAQGEEWSQRAELQLIEIEATAGPDSLRYATLESGFSAFLDQHADSPQRDRALLGLADARRQQAASDSSRLQAAIDTYSQLRQLHPDSPHLPGALFGLGLCHASLEAGSKAIDLLEQVLQNYPNSRLAPQVLFELGRLLLAEGRSHDAISRYQELRWAYPTFAQRRAAQLQLADIYYRLEAFDEAIVLYKQLLEGEEEREASGHLRRRLGQAYHRRGAFAAALETYRQLLVHSPPSEGLDSVYFSQAILLVQLGRQEEAIAQFQRLRDDFASSPLAPEATVRAGHLLFALERYGQAYALYQPLLSATPDPETYGRAVLSLFRLQRLEEARRSAREFAKQFGERGEWNQRFRLEEGQYYLKKEEYDRALKIFRAVEEREGEWVDDGAYYAALTLWEQNRKAPAPEAAARALEAQTRFIEKHAESIHAPDVFLRLGNYHFTLHNYLQAAGVFKRVLQRATRPELGQEAIWRLLQSYQRAHEYDEAHKTAELLLRDFPDHPRTRDVLLEIGIILKEKGQYGRAIAQLEDVLEWAEGNQASEARFYIGESYQNMGEYRKAIQAYYRVSFHGADGFSQWITSADYKRAQCHESLAEYATAISVYQRIVQREGSDSPQGGLAAERIGVLRQRLE